MLTDNLHEFTFTWPMCFNRLTNIPNIPTICYFSAIFSPLTLFPHCQLQCYNTLMGNIAATMGTINCSNNVWVSVGQRIMEGTRKQEAVRGSQRL